MSSFLNTTDTTRRVTAIPENAKPAQGIEALHGHLVLIRSNPRMIKYEAVDTPLKQEPQLPEGGHGFSAMGPPKCYQVTERVEGMAAGVWDRDSVCSYEFINLEKGVFLRIRSPLNIVAETFWTIQEKPAGDGHELVEEVTIKCSRLLFKIVKKYQDNGWNEVHQYIVDQMRPDA